MNGDMAQAHREKLVERLKAGKLTFWLQPTLHVDWMIASATLSTTTSPTIQKLTFTESVVPAAPDAKVMPFCLLLQRERRMLAVIERATGQRITPMQMPTTSDINKTRVAKFHQRISRCIAVRPVPFYENLLSELVATEGLKCPASPPHWLTCCKAMPLLMDESEPEPAVYGVKTVASKTDRRVTNRASAARYAGAALKMISRILTWSAMFFRGLPGWR